ncbi:uncharacterized protein RBU57_010945 [Macrochelys suwanniensis]
MPRSDLHLDCLRCLGQLEVAGAEPPAAALGYLCQYGPLGKRGQVDVSPGPVHRVHWCSAGRFQGQGLSPPGQIPDPQRAHSHGHGVPHDHSQDLPTVPGPLGGVHIHGPPRQASNEASPALAGLRILPGSGQYGQGPHGTGSGANLPSVVDHPDQYLARDPLPGTAPVARPGVGRVGLGLGSPCRELPNPGIVVGRRAIPTHKCQGAQGSPLGPCGVQLAAERQDGQGPYGQHGPLSLWEFCIAHDISLRAFHLPGINNSQADCLSRVFSSQHEWSLHSEVTGQLFRAWGTPRVDLFATRQNRRCHQFCSRGGLEKDALSDAFLLSWSGQLLYAFPPFPLIDKVLEKVKRDRVHVLLIAPAWARQHWYGTLLGLLVAPLHPLPLRPDLLSQDQGHLLHPNLASLHLTAWLLSG